MKSVMQVWITDKIIWIHFQDAALILVNVTSENSLTQYDISEITAHVKIAVANEHIDTVNHGYKVEYNFEDAGAGEIVSLVEMTDKERVEYNLSVWDLENS